MRLLFVASDRMEFQGILSQTANVRTVKLALDWSRSVTLNGNEVLLVANGAGPKRAADAVDAALAAVSLTSRDPSGLPTVIPSPIPPHLPSLVPSRDREGASDLESPPLPPPPRDPKGVLLPFDAIVSLGFCGALDDRLGIAEIVAATSIVGSPAACSPCTPAPRASGPICSIDHVAGTAAEKLQLRASGAIAVEMEASGVARRAAALGLPFFVIKAVTDLAGETMANDFNAALRSDGHFDTIKVFTGTLRHPTVRIPELIRLRNRCVRAARVLGEFIADCRF